MSGDCASSCPWSFAGYMKSPDAATLVSHSCKNVFFDSLHPQPQLLYLVEIGNQFDAEDANIRKIKGLLLSAWFPQRLDELADHEDSFLQSCPHTLGSTLDLHITRTDIRMWKIKSNKMRT